ncbi:MAG: hypothetical protein D6690_04005 [Nitrospirae bacterium]|nr:MAG: hypothetical protein D6690_04005 [Nitrospirota bacterium]
MTDRQQILMHHRTAWKKKKLRAAVSISDLGNKKPNEENARAALGHKIPRQSGQNDQFGHRAQFVAA